MCTSCVHPLESRVLKETDNPLVVRNELLTNNRTGIRCVLRKVLARVQ